LRPRPSLVIDPGLLDQHYRDIVTDWINKITFVVYAFKAAFIVGDLDLRFALRTTQDFKKFGTDCHF